MARVEDDWLTRLWKIARWPLYALLLVAALFMIWFTMGALAVGD